MPKGSQRNNTTDNITDNSGSPEIIAMLHALGDGCERHFKIVTAEHDGALSIAFKLARLKPKNKKLAMNVADHFDIEWKGFSKTLDLILSAANQSCVHPSDVQKIHDFRWFASLCEKACQQRNIYGDDLMANWKRLHVAKERGNSATRPFFKYS